MTIHELKIWPEYFLPIIKKEKTFELRKADRDFKVGDKLKLNEYDPETKTYSGRSAIVKVTYILDGLLAIPDTCLMSIEFEDWFNHNVGHHPSAASDGNTVTLSPGK